MDEAGPTSQYGGLNRQNRQWLPQHGAYYSQEVLCPLSSAAPDGVLVVQQNDEDTAKEPTESDLIRALSDNSNQHATLREKIIKFVFDDNGDEQYSLTAFGVVQRFYGLDGTNSSTSSLELSQEQPCVRDAELQGYIVGPVPNPPPTSALEDAFPVEPHDSAVDIPRVSLSLQYDSAPASVNTLECATPAGQGTAHENTSSIPGPPSEDTTALLVSHGEDVTASASSTYTPQNQEHAATNLSPGQASEYHGPPWHFSQEPHKTLSWFPNQWVSSEKEDLAALRPFELLYMYSKKSKRPAEHSGFLPWRTGYLEDEKKAGRPVGDGTQGGGSKLAGAAYRAMKGAQTTSEATVADGRSSSKATTKTKGKEKKGKVYAPLTKAKISLIKSALVNAKAAIEEEGSPDVKAFLQTVYEEAWNKLDASIKESRRQAARKEKNKARKAVALAEDEQPAQVLATGGPNPLETENTGLNRKRGAKTVTGTEATSRDKGKRRAQDVSAKENQPEMPTSGPPPTLNAQLHVPYPSLGTYDNNTAASVPNSAFGRVLPYGNVPNIAGPSTQHASLASSSHSGPFALPGNRSIPEVYSGHQRHIFDAPSIQYSNPVERPIHPQQQFIYPTPSAHTNTPLQPSPTVGNINFPFTFTMPHDSSSSGAALPIQSGPPYLMNLPESTMNTPALSPIVTMGMGTAADFTFQSPSPVASTDLTYISSTTSDPQLPSPQIQTPWALFGDGFDLTGTQF